MNLDLDNPFSVTKATEFTDQEIFEYWVDFNTEDRQSLINFLNPKEFLPKYILGGKGCGKTHILRYFSFPLQKIRKKSCSEIIKADGYLGVYSVLDGLNSSRFDGKGISSAEWEVVFHYYFELYLCNNLLNVMKDVLQSLAVPADLEKEIALKASTLLYRQDEDDPRNLDDLLKILNNLKRKIDLEIVNAPFRRKLDYDSVTILFSPGDLIFGIPSIISSYIPDLKETKIVYILDEYEKLFEWQKVFINTLVWDKKNPCTFWIGARKYGYTTRQTKTGEEIKPGSEFQPVELDLIIRKNETLYIKFAKELYINRLKKYYKSKGIEYSSDELTNIFEKKLEDYSDAKIIEQVKRKANNKEYKHVRHLRENLKKGIDKKLANGLLEDEIDELIKKLLLDTDNNPLEQKYKIFSFYQKWASSKGTKNLFQFADDINNEFKKYKLKEQSEFSNIEEKFKKDLLAQLTSESKIKNVCYSGIQEFIDISWGNPRSFILILKKIIEFSKLKGERPLDEGGLISLETQYLAVYDTAKWFYEDAEIIGEEGKNLYKAINFLAELFRVYRFSDKPTETSVSSFTYKLEEISATSLHYIKLAELHSVIVEIEEGRKEKNSGRSEKLYQLNKTLAPLWNLPSIRRGILSLDGNLAESIFNPDQHSEFNRLYREIKQKLNAPNFCRIDDNGKKKNGNGKDDNGSNLTLFN